VRFVELSLGGAGVVLSTPIEAGAAASFTVHTASGRELHIRALVCRVVPFDGEWLAGCEFERLLTEAEFAELV
jgi:PilZ domain-containing protein